MDGSQTEASQDPSEVSWGRNLKTKCGKPCVTGSKSGDPILGIQYWESLKKFSGYLINVIQRGILTYRPFLLWGGNLRIQHKKHLDVRQTPFEVGQSRPPVMPSTFEAPDDFGGNEEIRTQENLR